MATGIVSRGVAGSTSVIVEAGRRRRGWGSPTARDALCGVGATSRAPGPTGLRLASCALPVTAVIARRRDRPILCARRVRGVPLKPVDGHQPPGPQERPGSADRPPAPPPGRNVPQRLKAQPFPRPREPTEVGAPHLASQHPHAPSPPASRTATSFIVTIDEHRHREIHHDMRRQLPIRPLRLPTARHDHIIEARPRASALHRAWEKKRCAR